MIIHDYDIAVRKFLDTHSEPQAGDLLCFDGKNWVIARWHGIHYPVDPPKDATQPKASLGV